MVIVALILLTFFSGCTSSTVRQNPVTVTGENTPAGVHTAAYNTNQAIINATTRPVFILSGDDPRPDSNYDLVQLKAGMEVESEHSKNPDIQKLIAKDHLDENKDYYIILTKAGL